MRNKIHYWIFLAAVGVCFCTLMALLVWSRHHPAAMSKAPDPDGVNQICLSISNGGVCFDYDAANQSDIQVTPVVGPGKRPLYLAVRTDGHILSLRLSSTEEDAVDVAPPSGGVTNSTTDSPSIESNTSGRF